MAKIAIIGTGYVGLASAVGFAQLGHKVIGIDIDESKISKLQNGESPIFEEGIEDSLKKSLEDSSIEFNTNYEKIKEAEFIFLCLPTPENEDGSANLDYVLDAAERLNKYLKEDSTLIIKSTVPVNTWQKVKTKLNRSDVAIVSNPEFLREGTALADFFAPDRIVVGCQDQNKAKQVIDLYQAKKATEVITDNTSAEVIKYGSNSFLAVKLSFVNEIAAYCEATGANAIEVLSAMGMDKRIGKEFMKPGPGWGGMCFPKDVNALKHSAIENLVPIPLLDAALESNLKAHARIVSKLKSLVGNDLTNKVVTILGLTFKANTDDIRFSPAIAIAKLLINEGVRVKAYDPRVKEKLIEGIEICLNVEDSFSGSEAILVLTEWSEFANLEPKRVSKLVSSKNLIDTRNILNKELWEEAGFKYVGNGI